MILGIIIGAAIGAVIVWTWRASPVSRVLEALPLADAQDVRDLADGVSRAGVGM